MNSLGKIKNSMLWSAYGDSLGFITELADKRILKYRTGGLDRVTGLLPWTRKLGGQYGVSFDLPSGCYSDDTQLRLAVCRSIRPNGSFDVETFSKVELPVFLSYGLGVGTGTRTAAESLKKRNIQWNTNFFDTKESTYCNGGGNGGAMRIQPHVWCAAGKRTEDEILLDVIRNTIVTHGHFVGIIGACFHALDLQSVILNDDLTEMDYLGELFHRLKKVPDLILADPDLSLMWVPQWEKLARKRVSEAADEVLAACEHDVRLALDVVRSNKGQAGDEVYRSVVQRLGGQDKKTVGSGTKTALLASIASRLFIDHPLDGVVSVSNLLGSDTDTIATMMGAILGVTTSEAPPQPVLDEEYIISQAQRLFKIWNGESVETHAYPDLATWMPPKTSLDALGKDDEKPYLKGFGRVTPLGEVVEQSGQATIYWQSYKIEWGQTFILKSRAEVKPVSEFDKPVVSRVAVVSRKAQEPILPKKSSGIANGFPGFNELLETSNLNRSVDQAQLDASLDSKVELVKKVNFCPEKIGELVLEMAFAPQGIESMIDFSVSLAAEVRKTRKKISEVPLESIDMGTADVINSGFDRECIGRHVLSLSNKKDEGKLAGFVAIIGKALLARANRSRRTSTPV